MSANITIISAEEMPKVTSNRSRAKHTVEATELVTSVLDALTENDDAGGARVEIPETLVKFANGKATADPEIAPKHLRRPLYRALRNAGQNTTFRLRVVCDTVGDDHGNQVIDPKTASLVIFRR